MTNRNAVVVGGASGTGRAVLDDYLENTPLGRAGTPEDVKRYPDIYGHVMNLAEPQ